MEKQRNWLDYKAIKSAVTMEMALKHYNVFESLNKVTGQNALGCCPIHQGSNPRQFSVCLSKNIWRCFGSCNAGGNVLDFISKMEGVSIRDAALRAQKLLLNNEETEETKTHEEPPEKEQIKNDRKPVIKTQEEDEKEQAVNPPLKFTLKSLTVDHPFFAENAITTETVAYFGLGFCTKGLMKGRIAIPVHDYEGNLIAYCGRSISDDQSAQEGKYKMPPNFVRSEAVFNLHRQDKDSDTLVLVEDFLSAMKAHQSGFTNFAAIMGSNLGKGQEEAIFRHLGPAGKLVLLFSTSEYSQKCAEECLTRFSKLMYVKNIDISSFAETPCQLSSQELQVLL